MPHTRRWARGRGATDRGRGLVLLLMCKADERIGPISVVETIDLKVFIEKVQARLPAEAFGRVIV